MRAMSSATTSRTDFISMAQSLTAIVKSLPRRSPIWMALAPRYASFISTSLRSILERSSGGHLKDMSCVVTALLSLVPANPMRSRDMPMLRAMILTRRLVSQLRLVTVAMVKSPLSFALGGSEISFTMKSSGRVFRWPPVPSAGQR